MELRKYINNVTCYINENAFVTIKRSNGYTIGQGQKQIPAYHPDVTGYAQVQAVDNEELKHIEGMNLQGTYRVLYFSGEILAVVRPQVKGGDLVLFRNKEWKVVKVIEPWDDTWFKVFVCLQSP